MEATAEPLFENAGLAGVGQLMRIAKIDQVRSSRNLPNCKIKDTDILKIFCGMVAVGKVGFEHIHHVEHDGFFATALGIARMPGEASLRQRFESMSLDRRIHEDLPECGIRMLKKVKHPVLKVEVPGFYGVRVDTDSSIFDNSQSRKEWPLAIAVLPGMPRSVLFLKAALSWAHSCVLEISIPCMKDMKNILRRCGGE
jgi:hypothetical protein